MENPQEMMPAEKMDWLLEKLYQMAEPQMGFVIDIDMQETDPSVPAEREIKNVFGVGYSPEYIFYLKALLERGLLGGTLEEPQLTIEGLNYIINRQNETRNSTQCFVAMSFDSDENSLFDEAIAPACVETGFLPIRIDRHHPEAEQTINDAIIAELKRSRFCIADFTKHKKGVYFEAGYALGRGQKVIYTCRKDDFQDSHFDTNHYPHLLYSSPTELKQMLIDKINAWVKD